MRVSLSSRTLVIGATCLFVAALAGCARKDDLNKAQSVVETALESWKKAEDPRSLVGQGIEINDPDWKAGHRLLDYTVKSAVSQPQQGPRVVVELNLQTKAGKKIRSEVAYEVIIADTVKIGRDAFHVAAQ